MVYFITFSISLLLFTVIHLTRKWHLVISGDHDMKSAQKFHIYPVSRISGIGIFIGILVLLLFNDESVILKRWVLCATPVFISGILEDFTKKIPAKIRLLFSYISSILVFFYLDLHIEFKWSIIDNVLSYEFIHLILVSTFIAGSCNATNIIDGFNGLLLGYTLLALGTLYLVSVSVSDTEFQFIFMGLIMVILPLFLMNILGLMFTGDGGAYLIGFLISSMGLLFIKKHPDSVSIWVVFSILIYPIFETLFSIYRKFFIKRISAFKADGLHFHMLIYIRRVNIYFFKKSKNLQHIITAFFFWFISALPMVIALLFYQNPLWIITGIIVFIIIYMILYTRIIHFKTIKLKRDKKKTI